MTTNAGGQGSNGGGDGQQGAGGGNGAGGDQGQQQQQQQQQQQGGQGQQQNQGEQGQQQQQQQSKVPEKYELKLPEKSLLAADFIEKTAATARELGLSNEHAQKLLEGQHAAVHAYHEGLVKDFDDRVKGWLETLKTDKDIAGPDGSKLKENLELVKITAKKWAGDELVQALDESGMGNHPAVVRMFLSIAKASQNDQFVPGNAGGAQKKTHAELLFGGN